MTSIKKTKSYLALEKQIILVLSHYERLLEVKNFPLVLKELIFSFYGWYVLEWSQKHKSEDIKIIETNDIHSSVCELVKSERRSIRAEYPLPNTHITKWTVDCVIQLNPGYHFFGIITGDDDTNYESLAYWDNFKICYGMDSFSKAVYISTKFNRSKQRKDKTHLKYIKNLFKLTLEKNKSNIIQFEYNPIIGELRIKQEKNVCKIKLMEKDKGLKFYPAISFHCSGVGARCTLKLSE